MTVDTVISIARDTLWLIIKTAAPMLITSLVVGLVISIFQTVTSIQEQTLTFVPKLIATFLVILLFGGWIMTSIAEFTEHLVSMFATYVNTAGLIGWFL